MGPPQHMLESPRRAHHRNSYGDPDCVGQGGNPHQEAAQVHHLHSEAKCVQGVASVTASGTAHGVLGLLSPKSPLPCRSFFMPFNGPHRQRHRCHRCHRCRGATGAVVRHSSESLQSSGDGCRLTTLQEHCNTALQRSQAHLRHGLTVRQLLQLNALTRGFCRPVRTASPLQTSLPIVRATHRLANSSLARCVAALLACQFERHCRSERYAVSLGTAWHRLSPLGTATCLQPMPAAHSNVCSPHSTATCRWRHARWGECHYCSAGACLVG